MPIDFTGMFYTSSDGKFRKPLDSVHVNTFYNAFVRFMHHKTGNEALAVASEAKKKNGGVLADDVRDSLIEEAREKIWANAIAGTIGELGYKAPRMPGENEEETEFNSIVARDTRKILATRTDLVKPGEAKDTWISLGDNSIMDLAHAMGNYLKHPTLGAEREAAARAEAKRRVEAKQAEREAARKAKEREAKAKEGPKPEGEGLVF